jgi:hypothetical protein
LLLLLLLLQLLLLFTLPTAVGSRFQQC